MYRILLLSLLLFSSGFLKAQGIQCFVLTAPETCLPDIKRISVLDFTGEKGRELTDYLIVELLKPDRGIKGFRGFFLLAEGG